MSGAICVDAYGNLPSGGPAGGGVDWTWWTIFASELSRRSNFYDPRFNPFDISTGEGSCWSAFTDAVKEPIQATVEAVHDNEENHYFETTGATAVGLSTAITWFADQLRAMGRSGQLAPDLGKLAVAGAAAASRFGVTASARAVALAQEGAEHVPHVALAAADVILANGVRKEIVAAAQGTCKP